jgi:YegS/Rv2252/BmrU family lipid kinase
VHRHIIYIVNPISGTKNKGSLRELIEEKTRSAGIPFEIVSSAASGDYRFLLPEVEKHGTTDIVIGGGDGTINGVLSSLHTTGLRFGILPLGSGNGLAWSAKLPAMMDKALDVILAGKAVHTDAFTINGKFACMLSGLGFDAQVAHDFANDPNRGLVTYVKKTVSNFFSANAFPFTIHAGEQVLETEAFFISVANSNQFGNHFTIAPKASLTDGLLDIVIMTRQNKLNLLYQTMRQVGGFNSLVEANIQNSNASVVYFQTEEINILNPSRAPLHIDGDPVDTAEEIQVKVIPGCFQLLVP